MNEVLIRPPRPFVGLSNFTALLNDSLFIRSMQNTILLVVVVTMVTFAFALIFASILTHENVKGKNLFRVIFYIPNYPVRRCYFRYLLRHL